MRFLSVAGSALMGDQMGTGKTPQTIEFLERTNAYPALIVAPNSVKRVWANEFAKWAPNRRVVIARNGTKSAQADIEEVRAGRADVLVINWEALKNLSRLAGYGSIRLQTCTNCDPTSTRRPASCEVEDKALQSVPWVTIVADEAHRAKNPRAAQTRALWALGDRAERRVALTGTPIANAPDDLWSIMRFVSPDEYPAKTKWVERYAQLVPNLWSGGYDVVGFRPDRREEFDRFFLPRFIRRTKAQVLPELADKMYETRYVDISGKQRKAYDDMADTMLAQLDDGTLAVTNALTAALRLRQFAAGYVELDAEGKPHLSEPSSKLDELEAVLEELGDRQAVVFAESAQLIELAYARLLKAREDVGMIIGAVDGDTRARLVDDFQAHRLGVLLATVGAGGEGLTLTAADTAIFLQRPWSAVLNSQAEDRIHRVGQEAEKVTYIDLVTTDTIEDRVFEVLAEKAEKLEDLVRDEETLRKWLS